jgi:L-alanine-DL-glutamate epimerase-like enolase superfamily enzyme
MFLGQAAMAYGAFLLHARAQGTLKKGWDPDKLWGPPVSLDGEGFLQVRTKPGIGVALNEDVVKERTDPEFHPL